MAAAAAAELAQSVGRSASPALVIDGLTVRFRRRHQEPVTVVDDLSLTLGRGRALAVVGESGSGKSVSMRALLGLLPASADVVGSAVLTTRTGATELIGLPEKDMRLVRGAQVGMVFQNAMTALNPTVTLLTQLTEPLRWHGLCDEREAKERAVQALADVGIPEPARRVRMYPFQLSGGMRQRAMIATAMIANPEVIIADEPTTAVDVTVQKQILDLLLAVKEQGTSVIMITHDLGVARYLCDDVGVLYAGRLMEHGTMADFIDAPLHPYSQGLFDSVVDLDSTAALRPIPGSPPDPAHRPAGCAFHPRCPRAELPSCAQPQQLRQVGTRDVACWKADGE